MKKVWLIVGTLFFAGSLSPMGKSEIMRLNATLQEKAPIIFSETAPSDVQLAAIAEAQTIISELLNAETSGKTSEHLFIGITLAHIAITESTRAHIMQKLKEMNEALEAKKELIHETRHQEELEEMLSHINGIEHDHHGLAQRLLEILDRRRS